MLFKNQKLNKNFYTEISEGQAKRLYRNGESVWVSNGEISSRINIKYDACFPNLYGMRFYMNKYESSCNDIIVTRHPNVERYFREHGLENAPCVTDLRNYEYKNKNIYCASAPLKMASYANNVVCLNLDNKLHIDLDSLSYEEFLDYVKNCTQYSISSSEWRGD
jgi:hypothetical protein